MTSLSQAELKLPLTKKVSKVDFLTMWLGSCCVNGGECALHIGGFGDVGSDSGLVHSVQHVLAVHGQRVRCGEHLLLALLLQRGDGVLLGQPHFADQLGHVVVQQLLGALDLQGEERRCTQLCFRAFSSIFCSRFLWR